MSQRCIAEYTIPSCNKLISGPYPFMDFSEQQLLVPRNCILLYFVSYLNKYEQERNNN